MVFILSSISISVPIHVTDKKNSVKASTIFPEYAEAYYQKGKAYEESRNVQAAVDSYVQLIQLDSFKRGYRGDNIRAIENRPSLARKNPKLALLYYRMLARFYMDDLNLREIENGFEQISKLNPDFADAYYYKGLIRSYPYYFLSKYYDRSNRPDSSRPSPTRYQWREDEVQSIREVIADFSQAIQLKPTFVESYYFRALLRSQLTVEDKREALNDFAQVIQLQPNYAEAYYHRGLTRSQLGDEQGAIQDFIQALKLYPQGVEMYGKGVAQDFIQTLQTLPESTSDYYQRGLVRFKLKDPKATDDFNQVIRRDSNFVDAYFWRGSFLHLVNRNEADDTKSYLQSLVADFTRAIEINSNTTDAYFERGLSRINSSSSDADSQIVEDMTRAIQSNPHFAEAYFVRARILTNQSRATKDFIQAIRIDPHFMNNFFQAGYYSFRGDGIAGLFHSN